MTRTLYPYHMTLVITRPCLFSGEDEKRKRQERLKKNHGSNSSVSSKTHESVEGSDKETSETVLQPNSNAVVLSNESVIGSTPILIVPEAAATTVSSESGSETAVLLPVASACELNSETTNLLNMSKVTRLGRDGLSSSLSADLMSVIENSINASVTTNLNLVVDGSTDLTRTLTDSEERVIQELVQVSSC